MSNTDPPRRTTVKILVIGESGVGKTSLMFRFTDPTFDPSAPIAQQVDSKFVCVDLCGKPCRLLLWDTAGQERFRTITATYYRGAACVAVVFDITNKESFAQVGNWFKELNRYCQRNVSKVLIGNKSDLESQRAVTREEILAFATENRVEYCETNIFDAEIVNKAFLSLGESAVARMSNEEVDDDGEPELTDISKPPKKPKKKCSVVM